MNEVYAIRNDGFKYKEITLKITDIMGISPDDVDERKVMKFNKFNLPMSEWWNVIKTCYKQIEGNPPAEIPDIYVWRSGAIVLSPKAYSALNEDLSSYGELLPLECEGQTYYLFNCLTLGQADEINSEQEVEGGAFMGVKKIAFNTVDVTGKLIFKTTFDRCSTLYCGAEFKNILTSKSLTGVIFKEDLANIF
jgi:hypothetical protein